jgi:GntR family transcriptional regulator
MPAVNAKKRSDAAAEAGSAPGIPHGAIPNLTATEALPLYEKAKRHMSEAILMGEWPPGTVLPNETTLAQMFGIAVGTVRRAMSDLVAEGLLSRRRKTGTVVTGRSPHHSMRIFFQYFRLHRADGTLVRSRAEVLSVDIQKASERESEQLQIARGAEVLKIHRIRHVDDRPVMHDRMTLAADRVPGLPLDPKAMPELLYIHLLERYGIRISAVREQLTADLANEEDAHLLALTLPAPILTIDDTAYDQGGAPTILGRHRATTERHRYITEVR